LSSVSPTAEPGLRHDEGLQPLAEPLVVHADYRDAFH
jgi:hypothetical protein